MKLPTTNKIETKEIKFNDEIIKVKQYITASNKNDLIAITLQKCIENNVINVIKKEIYFYCYLIKMYTDIEFNIEDDNEEAVYAIYDNLESNGIIQAVIDAIPDEEYYSLTDALNKQVEHNIKYYHSTAGILNSIITDLPKNAAAAAQIVESFNPEKYGEILNFYNAINNNRAK